MSKETENVAPRGSRLRLLAKIVGGCVVVALWLWSAGFAYCMDNYISTWAARLLAALIAVGIPIVSIRFPIRLRGGRQSTGRTFVMMAFITFAICYGIYLLMTPTHHRQWNTAQSKLPFAKIDLPNNQADIHNIRSFRYGPTKPDQSHYNDTYDLSKLKRVWFGVDRFTELEPLAHTFISFEFEPGSHRTNFLAFSVETRRELSEETYSPIRGIFNNYETIYVIADERDVLSVRSDVRQNVVQLYPIKSTPTGARAMLIDMLNRANDLKENPEFYNTVTNNCTNNIVVHTNKILEQPISAWQRGVVFPGYSDWLAHQKGLIDTELSLEAARETFRIDEKAKDYDGTGDFSNFIRGMEERE